MVAQILSKGDSGSQRLANAISSGELEVFYGNLPSSRNGTFLEGTKTLTLNGNQNYSGLDGLYRAALTTRHEGQHFLDDISKVNTRGLKSNESYFEARAFLSEQKLADKLGVPELGTLGRLEQQLGSRADAWQHIKDLYDF